MNREEVLKIVQRREAQKKILEEQLRTCPEYEGQSNEHFLLKFQPESGNPDKYDACMRVRELCGDTIDDVSYDLWVEINPLTAELGIKHPNPAGVEMIRTQLFKLAFRLHPDAKQTDFYGLSQMDEVYFDPEPLSMDEYSDHLAILPFNENSVSHAMEALRKYFKIIRSEEKMDELRALNTEINATVDCKLDKLLNQ